MKNLLKKVRLFTQRAHASVNHRRKYTDEPYHVHPARVAKLVASVTTDAEIIAAAWLHDVLEDVAPTNPEFDAEAIEDAFGKRVLTLVLEVTDISTADTGNRESRKALDRIHLANASNDGKTIKLADLIDNLIDIRRYDVHFAKVFAKEAKILLPLLQGGNVKLWSMLEALLLNDQ
jgi:(p)ppGpp synthase/HD superfamily hydrolase